MASLLISSIFFLSLLCFAQSKDVLVGGKPDSWKVPSSQSDSLNKWAQSARFRVGDNLVFKYNSGEDSVVQVTEEGYKSCNTSSPVAEYNDGDSKVELDRSGPFYFISGAMGHCEQGQKMVVVVLSERRGRYSGVSPAPSQAESEAPAVAPTSGANSFSGGIVFAAALGFLSWGFSLV